MMPIVMRTRDKNHIKKIVVASLIHREEDIFLCGL